MTPWKKFKAAQGTKQKRKKRNALQLGIPLLAIILCLSGCGAILEQDNLADLPDPPSISSDDGILSDTPNSQAEGNSSTQGKPTEGAQPPAESPGDTQGEQFTTPGSQGQPPKVPVTSSSTVSLSEIPAFSGEPYVALNNNTPTFGAEELTTASFETYSSLDNLGRCGVAYACIGTDLMPTEERGSIGQVKPSGWHTVKYDVVDGKYLYNRCHLIGFQLSGENANERNLITGTRYMNVDGMLPFENMVADYVKETGNHVMYRVTPIYSGNNLVANGVQIEAQSVEDDGDGILFNVYVYNNQPGVGIDYATGESWLESGVGGQPSEEKPITSQQPSEKPQHQEPPAQTQPQAGDEVSYVLNTNTKKFHIPSCSSVDSMSSKNRQDYTGTRDEVIAMGYDPCGRCHP